MTLFDVKAIAGSAAALRLELRAPHEPAARELARAQGLTVLSIRRKSVWSEREAFLSRRFPLTLFSQELVALLSAGISLPEVLDTMAEKEARPDLRRTFLALRQSLNEGRSLSRSLERFPESFPPLYVATIRSAERSGDIAEALGRYIAYEERLDAVRKRVRSASVYPIVLAGVGALVVAFLLGYVVPRFAGVYEDVGRDIPWASRLLLEWGRLVDAHAGLLVLALAASVAIAILARAKLKAAGLRLLARLPAIGERVRVYHLARFYRTLGMLLRGGIPLVPALGMVAGLLPDSLRRALAGATGRIREGASLSVAMAAAGLTTPVAVRLLRVGEKSGEMADMMDRIAVFHDEELARWVDVFTRLFEPILMAAIGIAIGAIVVLMYLPIFELAGSLQ